MPVVTLLLNSRQLAALSRGKSFRLTADQLAGSDPRISKQVEVELPPKLVSRINRAKRRNSGVVIPQGAASVSGGAFNVKDFGNLLASGAEQIKKAVPKKVVKGIARGALGAVGVDGAVADSLVDNTVNSAYSTNFKEKGSMKKFGRRAAAGVAQDGLEYGVAKVQSAIAGGRLQKGSPEMKERMAALRAMRRGGKSTSSAPVAVAGGRVKSMVKSIEQKSGAYVDHHGGDAVSGDFVRKERLSIAPHTKGLPELGPSIVGRGIVPIGGRSIVPIGGGAIVPIGR